MLFCLLFEPTDKICFVCNADQATNLDLMTGWQILKAIDAFVGVRQRKQIEQDIDGRKHPQKEAVADEVAADR